MMASEFRILCYCNFEIDFFKSYVVHDVTDLIMLLRAPRA